MRLINSGYRLPPPPGCPRSIYEMMIRCWYNDISIYTILIFDYRHPVASNRPTFVELVSTLLASDTQLLVSSCISNEMKEEDDTVLGGPLENAIQPVQRTTEHLHVK